MQKTLLITAGIIVLAGIGYFAAQQAGVLPPSLPGTSQAPTAPGSSQQETVTGSLQKLLGMGKSLKCTWSAEEASGTSWIKNQNVYTEVQAQGQTSKTIMKDNCMWVWAEGQAQGVKSCYQSFEEMQEEATAEGTEDGQDTGSAAVAPNVNYNCVPASIADSKFNPPQDVQFMDLNETMPSGIEDMQNMSEEELEELQQQMEEIVPEGM